MSKTTIREFAFGRFERDYRPPASHDVCEFCGQPGPHEICIAAWGPVVSAEAIERALAARSTGRTSKTPHPTPEPQP